MDFEVEVFREDISKILDISFYEYILIQTNIEIIIKYFHVFYLGKKYYIEYNSNIVRGFLRPFLREFYKCVICSKSFIEIKFRIFYKN